MNMEADLYSIFLFFVELRSLMKHNTITFPPFLQSGDTIGICATARKVSPAEMENAIKILESWGLFVVLGKNLFGECNQYSGTDIQRIEDLQNFLDDPNIKAVISGRGGYGTLRIIDQIDFTEFNKNPKWIIGYSDITVLHSHIHTNCHVATLHATMPINFGKDEFSTESSDEFSESESSLLSSLEIYSVFLLFVGSETVFGPKE